MKFTKTILAILLVLVLVLVVAAPIYVSREYFVDIQDQADSIAAGAPDVIPPIDSMQIAIVKKGIINVIEKRPDVVHALQDVFADPAINPTLQKIINPSAMPSTTTQSLQSYLTPAPSCSMACHHEESCE